MTTVVCTGFSLAASHAAEPCFLMGRSQCRANSNSSDHSQTPSRIGGMVSGPGSTISASPSRISSRPATNSTTRRTVRGIAGSREEECQPSAATAAS